MDEEVKYFDDTAAFIFGSSASSGLHDSVKVESKGLIIKTETTCPVKDEVWSVEEDVKCFDATSTTVNKSAASPVFSGTAVKEEPLDEELYEEPLIYLPVRDDLPLEPDPLSLPDAASKQAAIRDVLLQAPHCSHQEPSNLDLKNHIESTVQPTSSTIQQLNKVVENHDFNQDVQWEQPSSFSCPNCPYTSNRKKNLHVHIKSRHMQVKAFQCPHCEYKSNYKSRLSKHIQTVHMKLKAFQCSHCEYKSNYKARLSKHIQSMHMKFKALQCRHCEFKANHKFSLNKHIQSVHMELKSFACPHCEYKSNSRNHLSIHIQSVHMKIKAFECPQCEFKTNYKSYVNKHIKAMHTK